MEIDLDFFRDKKVLITGHTGFKGTWMCKLLCMVGANVTGYALNPPTSPNLYEIAGVGDCIDSITGDVRDYSHLKDVFDKVKPEIVIHMAAQPIVRESYKNPVYTYETNVMGTVNVLECVRQCPSVRSFINVTTDKVYLNREWCWGYRENDELKGFDPYSNSKSCSELVTYSYINSFFLDRDIAVSTCRAGNVIGGGDFAVDRIIPDCVRAAFAGDDILVRNSYSIRPYQHVLEPVTAYLMIAKAQYMDRNLAGCYNIGPDDVDCLTTGELVRAFCDEWVSQTGDMLKWADRYDGGPHEAAFLKLDCSKMKQAFKWQPRWHVREAVRRTVEWSVCYKKGMDAADCMKRQIEDFLS